MCVHVSLYICACVSGYVCVFIFMSRGLDNAIPLFCHFWTEFFFFCPDFHKKLTFVAERNNKLPLFWVHYPFTTVNSIQCGSITCYRYHYVIFLHDFHMVSDHKLMTVAKRSWQLTLCKVRCLWKVFNIKELSARKVNFFE